MFPFLAPLFATGAATAATVGAVGTIGAGLIGANTAKKTNKSTQEFNAAEARAADKRSEEMQIRAEQRAYNRSHPKHLRKRMEEAGFNPLLSMGPGIGGAPTGVSAPQASFAPAAYDGAAQGQIIADGLTGAVDAITAPFSAKAQLEYQKAQLDMKHQALADLAKKVVLNPNVPGIYGGSNGGSSYTANSAVTDFDTTIPSTSGTIQAGAVDLIDLDAKQYTIDGRTHLVSEPGLSEESEKNYGEIGSMIDGTGAYIKDSWRWNMGEAYDPKWGWESQWPKPKPNPHGFIGPVQGEKLFPYIRTPM